jgi:hypothetical protein
VESPRTAAAAAARQGRGRLLVDRDGNVRAAVVLGIFAFAAALFALGTYVALLVANAGTPEALALWVVAGFVIVKIPLLGIAWWLIARRRDPQDGGGWSSGECEEILAYLEEQARASAGRPDAATRLAYFAREAWFVADAAADADKPAAVATAVRIDALASRAGAGGGRRTVTGSS